MWERHGFDYESILRKTTHNTKITELLNGRDLLGAGMNWPHAHTQLFLEAKLAEMVG